MKTNSKTIFVLSTIILIVFSLIQSCGDDSTQNNSNNSNQTTIKGSWSVEAAQMVQAPPGNTSADLMKQALVPFGQLPASSVGYCNVNFGDTTWSLMGNITNSVIRVICHANDTFYNASGLYSVNSNNITFIVQQYSGSLGNQTVGQGTFVLGEKLTIELYLANNEHWKFVFKR